MDLNPYHSPRFNFDFQVWRPSPTVNETGCYGLVGNYTNISISIPDISVSNHVARVTPLPQDQLQFQPGDVLGFYVESHGEGTHHDNGVVLLNNGSHTSELVWFASIDITSQTSQSGSCPYPVGTTGVLNSSTHAAPVISVSVMTASCPLTSSSSLSSIISTSMPHSTRTTFTDPVTISVHGPKSGTISSSLIAGIVVSICIVVFVIIVIIIFAVIIMRNSMEK